MSLTESKLRAHVAIIRAQADVFMTDTIMLRHKIGEEVIDGESFPTFAPDVEIRARIINRSGASRSNIAAQFRATRQTFYDSTYRIQLPYGTEVSVTDYAIYEDTGTGVTRTFEITYVPPQHEMTGAFVVGAEEIQ